MRRTGLWLALVAAVVVVAALAPGCRRKGREPRPDWRVVSLYGGAGSVEALTKPVSVEAYRISPLTRPPEPGVAYIGVHRVTAGPMEVPGDVADRLSAILADADTYDWHHAKGDPYLPSIGLRFTRDVSRADIAFDFASNMLTAHRHGERCGVEDFDDARPELLAIMKSLFPDDDDVQAIE